MNVRPGGKLAARPLDFIFILDTSTSMQLQGKIEALNEAIRTSLVHMKRVSDDNPNAVIRVRAIEFASGARWHIEEPLTLDELEWKDLGANGLTDMGAAFELLTEALDVRNMEERALPPVLVLISDGVPTDNYETSLSRFLKLPWGTKAVKLAIAIGRGANEKVLKEFINNETIEVLKAENAAQLVEYIKWASTVVVNAASSPASTTGQGEGNQTNVLLPAIPVDFWDNFQISVEDVW